MYAKVFSQIYDGTLCTNGPWEALVTFQQMLILADKHGVVDLTAGAIARRTTIPLPIIEKGIAALLLPDPDSRTPTEEGRRIVPLSDERAWGWLVVNYEHYRALKREEDRREYHREYWRKKRSPGAKGKGSETQQILNTTQQPQPNQPIAEAEAEEIHTSPAKLPTCPIDLIVKTYHEILPELPRVRVMDEARKKAIRNLWNWLFTNRKPDGTLRAETPEQAIEWFRSYFELARENDFLMGRTPRSNGHQGWKCDLDFLLTSKGVKHVIEKTEVAA